jgi:GntR family transcriptional regulator, arabinose operon transcriptional repressor
MKNSINLFVNRQSSIPPYIQIKNGIIELIESGEWKVNEGIISIRDIARITGVSLATAQKAFFEVKRQKLIYSKAGSGYFVTKQSRLSNTVFVFLPSSKLTFYTYILDGMFDANRDADLNIQIYSLDTDKLAWNQNTAELLRKARNERSSVIFIEEAFGDIRHECLRTAQNVPFVSIEWILENAISIVNDYRNAGFTMIDYCINQRKAKFIMVLKGRQWQYNARERILGMQDAAEKFSLAEGREIVFYDSDFDAISAYETIKKYYNDNRKDAAVICANDYEGMGAIGAFLEKRVLVGKDVVLLGFGNMIDSVTSYIPLTTIDQQLRLIGQKAIFSIDKMIKGRDERMSETIIVPTRLVERMT